MKALIATLAFFFMSIASAQSAGQTRLRCESLKEAWIKKYIPDFSIEPTSLPFSCETPMIRLAVTFADLEVIERSKPYLPVYSRSHSKVGKLVTNRGCNPGAVAWSDTRSLVVLCPAFFQSSREFRTSTLVHEARHLDRDAPLHVKCTRGPHINKKGACDNEISSGPYRGGSYNTDIWVWRALLESNLHDLKKDTLRSLIRDRVPARFNAATETQILEWRNL